MSDSVWATVLGISKIFNRDADYALNEISYLNALLYSRAMPMPGDGDEEDGNKPKFDASVDACNLDNFADFTEDEEIVRV